MPAIPSASYFEEGLLITSTFSMRLAGIERKPLASPEPTRPEGFPSMSIRTFSLPLKLTSPSTPTFTEGTLFKISWAEPPVLAKSFPTVKIFLSSDNCN